MVIDKIEDTSQFEKLKQAWDDLLNHSPASSVFLSWEWLFTWWRHFGQRRQLALFVGRSGDRLDLVAPFVGRAPELTRGKPWSTHEMLGSGSVGSDYLDVVLRRGTQAEGLERLTARLRAERVVLTMPRIHADAAAVRQLAERLVDEGWHARSAPADVCPYITLASHTWATYVDSLGREHRSNLRRRLKKLEDHFELRFEQVQSDEQRHEALDILVRLHNQRWQTRGGSTAFHTPELIAFHEAFSRLALERGWLRLFVLRLGTSPVAALYALRFGDTFSFYQSGFDPQYGHYGVGLVIMGLAIRQAISERAAEYDMLHGAEPYKFLWASQVRDLSHLELYPPTARGLVTERLTDLSRAARAAVRRVAWHTSAS